jgi:hypothetical protein
VMKMVPATAAAMPPALVRPVVVMVMSGSWVQSGGMPWR